jgi:hypothetical protein
MMRAADVAMYEAKAAGGGVRVARMRPRRKTDPGQNRPEGRKGG